MASPPVKAAMSRMNPITIIQTPATTATANKVISGQVMAMMPAPIDARPETNSQPQPGTAIDDGPDRLDQAADHPEHRDHDQQRREVSHRPEE